MFALPCTCLLVALATALPTVAASGIISDSPETDEEPVARMVGSTAKFNRVSFAGNVLERDRIFTEHWIVKFCYDWYSPCTGEFLETYQSRSTDIERMYNANIGAFAPREIRFVEVDCGTDKVLCNEQGVSDYPTLVHYHRGIPVAKWTPNGRKDIDRSVKWVDKQLRCLQRGSDEVPADCEPAAVASPSEASAWATRTYINAIVFGCLIVSLTCTIVRTVAPLLRARATSVKAIEVAEAVATPATADTASVRAVPRDWGHARSMHL